MSDIYRLQEFLAMHGKDLKDAEVSVISDLKSGRIDSKELVGCIEAAIASKNQYVALVGKLATICLIKLALEFKP